jgi:hypothetical protein
MFFEYINFISSAFIGVHRRQIELAPGVSFFEKFHRRVSAFIGGK